MNTLFILFSSVSFAVPIPDNSAHDLKKLEGRWVVIEEEQDGILCKDDPKDERLVFEFKSDKMVYRLERKEVNQFLLKVKSGNIDFAPTSGPQKGLILEGIYVIDGDTLKICRAMAGSNCFDPALKRPTKFKTEKDSDPYILYVLKRLK